MTWNTLIVSVLCALVLAYYYVRKKFNYWADRGVPFIKPIIPWGNIREAGRSLPFSAVLQNAYNELVGKGTVGGMYFFWEPVCMALDLDLLRNIFVKDFNNFTNRGMYINEQDDPLSMHLFNMEGGPWRSLRNKLSPTFTSGKMRMMHSTFVQVAEQMRDHLRTLTDTPQDVELKEILARFTTDVIGNVAFGIECNSLKEPNNEFRETGKLIFKATAWEQFCQIIMLMMPKLARRLRMVQNKPRVTEFFMNMMRETVKYREQNNVQRNDFMSLLLQIKNTGKLDGETVDLGTMTFEELAAQIFIFFVAGFETSSSTMTFAVYELALNPDIQQRAREEVRQVLARHDGVMSYDAVLEMKYLDRVIHETLRKYPIVDVLLRKAENAYQVPNSKVVLEKGQLVFIPVLGIHRDPKIYPDPDKFDPERFTSENIATRHPYSYLPFGEGPRNCIGSRFGLMQTRIGLATLLRDFELQPSSKTLIPIQIEIDAQLLSPVGGMVLKVTAL